MTSTVWLVLVLTGEAKVVNRIFTNEIDALRYAKDYEINTSFKTEIQTRLLRDIYRNWEQRE